MSLNGEDKQPPSRFMWKRYVQTDDYAGVDRRIGVTFEKSVTLGMLAALLLNISIGIWWVRGQADLNADTASHLEDIERTMDSLKSMVYTEKSADKAHTWLDQRINVLNAQMTACETRTTSRMDRMEDQINELKISKR